MNRPHLRKILIAGTALLLSGMAASSCFAQEGESDSDRAAREEEARKLMEQSQMSLPELMKAGIAPDMPLPESPSEEEKQRQIGDSQGGRPSFGPGNYPERQQYRPPTRFDAMQPQQRPPAGAASPAPGESTPEAFAGRQQQNGQQNAQKAATPPPVVPQEQRSAFSAVPPDENSDGIVQFPILPPKFRGAYLKEEEPAAPAPSAPAEPQQSVTEGF